MSSGVITRRGGHFPPRAQIDLPRYIMGPQIERMNAMLKTLFSSAAGLALMSGAALSGTLEQPAQPAPVTYTEVAAAPTGEWTGPYVGAQIGYANVGSSAAGVEGDGVIGGIVAGYDWDLGDWVIGLGLDYDFANIDLGPATLENVLRVKARGGRKVGSGLIYGTAGYAHAYTDTLSDDGGFFVGAGYEQPVSDQFSIGAELLYHEFSDFNGSGVDVDATTFELRGLFRF